MMTTTVSQKYIKVLKEELVMALGCTEPIAIAYAAATARAYLGAAYVCKHPTHKTITDAHGSELLQFPHVSGKR